MNDYCAYFANCLAGGDSISQIPKGGWIRDRIVWNFYGHEVILQQDESIITKPKNELTNLWIPTSTLIIKKITPSKIKFAENISKDIGWLLSFAGYSRVCLYKSEYPAGSGNFRSIATIGVAKYFRPMIDIDNGSDVKDFIQQCLPNYRKLKRKRKLPEVFDMLISSEIQNMPIELRLVSVFLALESLKGTYAQTKSIPYVKGSYRRINSPNKKYSFHELLLEMLQEYRIKKGLRRVITLRNDLIHSGISRRPYKSKRDIFETCHNILRIYLLKILGYSGKYYSYKEPNLFLKT